jgi:hypothetical protein
MKATRQTLAILKNEATGLWLPRKAILRVIFPTSVTLQIIMIQSFKESLIAPESFHMRFLKKLDLNLYNLAAPVHQRAMLATAAKEQKTKVRLLSISYVRLSKHQSQGANPFQAAKH